MKQLSFLIVAILVATTFSFSQERKSASTKTKSPSQKRQTTKTSKPAPVSKIPVAKPPVLTDSYDYPPPLPPQPQKFTYGNSVDWKTAQWRIAQIGKWGVDSLSLPAELGKGKELAEQHKNKDVAWTAYSHSWETPAEGLNLSSFKVDVFITTWNTDFAKVTGLKPEVATPENLLMVDQLADERAKESGVPPVEESSFLELDGIRGAFFRATHVDNKNRLMVGWYTYGYFQSNAQRISITVICPRSDLQEAMKIIQSIKFQRLSAITIK